MNKEKSISYFLDTIYSNNSKLVLTDEEIKRIENFYKENHKIDEEYEEYLKNNYDVIGAIKKIRSGNYELEKQYNKNESLQRSILSECNYIETLASIFKLNKCIDFDRTPLNSLPVECRKFLNSGQQTYSSARYLFYNPKQPDIFIFQYGNPAEGDAEIIIDGNKIKLEFKKREAKAGEYDLFYDESGKLIMPDGFEESNPELVKFVNQFNKETNLIDEIGHNYTNRFNEEDQIKAALAYFAKHDIDIYVSATKENDLVALEPDALEITLKDGSRIITTKGSEIRTTGRNPKKLVLIDLFDKIMNEFDAEYLDSDTIKVKMNSKIEIVNSSGSSEPGRVKFNKFFFVKYNKAKFEGNYVIFKKKDVYQVNPTLSIHLILDANKNDIIEYFEDAK